MGAPRSADARPVLKWIVGVCSLALFAPLAWPLVTGRIFPGTDLGNFHIPLRYLYQEALRAGDSLLWTPAMFAGFYIHGEGQIGLYHPLHLLLYRALPLQAAVNLELLATYIASFAGMYWLLRRLQLSTTASLFGGLLFGFSGFQLLHYAHVNAVAVAAHIPWLLACVDVFITADRPMQRTAGYAGVALVLASELLLGFPQGVWWNLLAVSGFALLRAGETRRWRRLAALAPAMMTGVLLGGIQLLPTLDMAAHSLRPLQPRSFSLMYSLHPWNVIQLWSPYAYAERVYAAADYLEVHELAIYPGALLTIAPLWLWIRRGALAHRRRFIVYASAFAAVMFVLALGKYGGLDILLTYLPGVGSLRAPVRYILLVQFTLAILAAIVFDDLATFTRNSAPLPRPDIAILCAAAALSLLTTALLNTHALPVDRPLPFSTVSRAAVGAAIVVAVTAAILCAARGMKWALPLLVVITAADLGLWGTRHIYRDPPQTIAWLTGGIPPAPAGSAPRIASPDGWGNRLILKNFHLLVGYVALYPAAQLPYTGTLFQQLAGARQAYMPNATLRPLTGAVERARLLQDVRVTDNAARDAGGVDVHRTALIDHAIPPLSGPPGSARVTLDRPGHLVVETSAEGRQLLCLSERFHEGWSATAEGRPLPTVAVYGDFLGVVVEAGTHRVDLQFKPASFSSGRLMSVVGLLCLVAGVAVMMRRW